jgi:hypothetical protein
MIIHLQIGFGNVTESVGFVIDDIQCIRSNNQYNIHGETISKKPQAVLN